MGDVTLFLWLKEISRGWCACDGDAEARRGEVDRLWDSIGAAVWSRGRRDAYRQPQSDVHDADDSVALDCVMRADRAAGGSPTPVSGWR